MFSQGARRGGQAAGGGRGKMGEGKLDADQEAKFQECVDLLLAGGYFRARIVDLNRFDKIVGGMAWCIMNSYVDLDIDLFFQEEASIGQRIRISEQVVAALLRMRCPHRLEPSQIQGGMNTADYSHIFPVIQWLVKQVIETRRETGDVVRQYSIGQFAKNFELPSDVELAERTPKASAFIEASAERYGPERKLKRPGRRVPYLNNSTEEENVSAALMEYGEIAGGGGAQGTGTDGEDGDSATSKLRSKLEGPKAREERLRREKEEEEKREALRATMQAAAAAGHAIDADLIEGLLGDLSSIEAQFGTSADALAAMDPEAAAKIFATRQHDQKVARLQKDIENTEERNAELAEKLAEIESSLRAAQVAAEEQEKYTARLHAEIAKLDAMVTDDNRATLMKLQSLVALNESLKQQASDFKENCKRQLRSFQGKISDLREKAESDAATRERQEVLATAEQDTEKLAKLRSLAALKARQIALVQRKVDEIPSRAELAQYQKQFVELYEQVAAKLIETRQYYESYNALQKQKEFLSKEVSIMQSCHDNYTAASSSRDNRARFLQSLDDIIGSVNANLKQQRQRYQQQKETKAKETAELSQLVASERAYYKASRELREESAKSVELQQQADALSSSS
jgi:CCDC93 coiled-coil domain/CCDC93 protein N-terminal domain